MMNRLPGYLILSLLLLIGFDCQSFAGPDSASHCVAIQPIVVRGDHGQNPAEVRVIETLVDQVYAKAGIDFHFFEPIFYDDTKARDGKINLDQIVARAGEAGMLRGQGKIVNMFFVNAVDGHTGPLGRGMQGGNLVFIALGKERNPGMEAFVVAHEVGHCLGLDHNADDAEVDDELVNLMGDGPFEERVGPDGLAPSQIKTLLKSQLVQERIRCLTVEEARSAMLDETFEPFFSQLERREMAVFLGRNPEGTTLEECRLTVKKACKAAVLAFSREEAAAIRGIAEQLEKILGPNFPLLAQQPWWFIKFESEFFGGFSHTRGPWILFSEGTTARILEAWKRGGSDAAVRQIGPLFVHEQMHVLQRHYPSRFARLYQEVFGYQQGDVAADPWLTERQLSNPDALGHAWIVPMADARGKDRWYWPRTIIRDTEGVPRMGHDFQDTAFHLEKNGEVFQLIVNAEGIPIHDPLDHLEPFFNRYPIKRGLDHPNEIAAYLFQRIFIKDYLKAEVAPLSSPDAVEMLNRLEAWCRTGLRLAGENDC